MLNRVGQWSILPYSCFIMQNATLDTAQRKTIDAATGKKRVCVYVYTLFVLIGRSFCMWM